MRGGECRTTQIKIIFGCKIYWTRRGFKMRPWKLLKKMDANLKIDVLAGLKSHLYFYPKTIHCCKVVNIVPRMPLHINFVLCQHHLGPTNSRNNFYLIFNVGSTILALPYYIGSRRIHTIFMLFIFIRICSNLCQINEVLSWVRWLHDII